MVKTYLWICGFELITRPDETTNLLLQNVIRRLLSLSDLEHTEKGLHIANTKRLVRHRLSPCRADDFKLVIGFVLELSEQRALL